MPSATICPCVTPLKFCFAFGTKVRWQTLQSVVQLPPAFLRPQWQLKTWIFLLSLDPLLQACWCRNAGTYMSSASPSSPDLAGCTTVVDPADLEAHIAKVKAAWRNHERSMTWEQKIAAIERMRERSAQLARAREKIAPVVDWGARPARRACRYKSSPG